MSDKKQISSTGIISPKKEIDINKTEITLDNESLSKINYNNQFNNNLDNLQNITTEANYSKRKSSLKGSKNKIKNIKKEIMNIFDEDRIMDRLQNFENNYNSININDIYKYQEIYENKLEKLFNS